MQITISGKDFKKEFFWHNGLVYNDLERDLSITYGGETFCFCNVRLKSIAWNEVTLTALTPIGSGSGMAPEERTITLKLLA